jgi:hypothetical protein
MYSMSGEQSSNIKTKLTESLDAFRMRKCAKDRKTIRCSLTCSTRSDKTERRVLSPSKLEKKIIFLSNTSVTLKTNAKQRMKNEIR